MSERGADNHTRLGGTQSSYYKQYVMSLQPLLILLQTLLILLHRGQSADVWARGTQSYYYKHYWHYYNTLFLRVGFTLGSRILQHIADYYFHVETNNHHIMQALRFSYFNVKVKVRSMLPGLLWFTSISWGERTRAGCAAGLRMRPISLLRLLMLRFVDSNIMDNSLWAW